MYGFYKLMELGMYLRKEYSIAHQKEQEYVEAREINMTSEERYEMDMNNRLDELLKQVM